MTSATARIVPLRRPGPHDSGAGDVTLRISGADGLAPRIEARSVDGDGLVATWHGEVARQLLGAPALRRIAFGDGEYACTKSCLRRLILAAAIVEAALERLAERRDAALAAVDDHAAVPAGFPPEPLARRLARLGVCPDGDARLVARVLFAYPGEHFTARDVGDLVSSVAPALGEADVQPSLRALADCGVIQPIEIDGGPTFYDIDTRPHAHRYDPATGRLNDIR